MRIAISAHTSFPNTRETDLLPIVDHDVTVRCHSGTEVVRVKASDPMDAIDRVQLMSDKTYNLLERIKA